MKIFLTTSFNQYQLVSELFFEIKATVRTPFLFYVVESGDSSLFKIIDKKFLLIKEDINAFWAKSIASGLRYIHKQHQREIFDLIILNCDVKLNNWSVLDKNIDKLTTFITIHNNTIKKSGYNITNWFIAKHEYPLDGKPITEISSFSNTITVAVVPTRLIVIPSRLVEKSYHILPSYKKLPHYASDFVFTHDIALHTGELWHLKFDYFLIEDLSSTGIKKAEGNIVKRLKLLFKKKTVFNISDRFWYALLISRKKGISRPFYIVSSISKLLVQLLF